jgi:hypothetical protein
MKFPAYPFKGISLDIVNCLSAFLNFCVERSPPIDEVIKAGVVPRFVEFLGRHDLPQLQVGTCYSFKFLCK